MSGARIYRLLLVLYPWRFREEFGADLVQLFEDQCRADGAPRVVARTALDLAISVPTLHLEAHMHRDPSPIVTSAYFVIAAVGCAVAVAGGTTLGSLLIGLALALVGGTLGVVSLRRAGARPGPVPSGTWWKLLLAGPLLVGAVIAAAGVGIEAWFLGLATVAIGIASSAAGVVLGVVHLFTGPRRSRGLAA